MENPQFQQISPHVYWLPPSPPDRPSLGLVVGERRSVMLDGGASPAHVALFMEGVARFGLPYPSFVVLTHWHWDHVFGAANVDAPVIAHGETAVQLQTLATYDWSDAAIDQRVQTGKEIEMCATDIKIEFPAPRQIAIPFAAITFDAALTLDLGGATCRVQHVGGDHAADSCVVHVVEDKLLFLGDCHYYAVYAPQIYYTSQHALPLMKKLLSFDANQFVEGHGDAVMSRAEFEQFVDEVRWAETAVSQTTTRQAALRLAQTNKGGSLTEDEVELIDCFIWGLGTGD